MVGIVDLSQARTVHVRRVCGVYPSVAGALVAAGERIADGAERIAVVALDGAWTPESLDIPAGRPLIVVFARPALTDYLTVER
jgi:hypothetical protein